MKIRIFVIGKTKSEATTIRSSTIDKSTCLSKPVDLPKEMK